MPPQSPAPTPALKEVVVAAWRDDADNLGGLGCTTPFNEQDPNLIFTVLLDGDKKRVFARLSLGVMVKGGGARKQRCFDFVVPLHSCNADGPSSLIFDSVDVSKIHDPSVNAAINDARLPKSGRLIRVNVTLSQNGVVVTPWKEDARFSTCSDTSLDLLCGLFSLSESRQFVLYMRPSGYAEAGLTLIGNLLQAGQLEEWLPKSTGIYGGRDVMTVGREHVESSRKPHARRKRRLPAGAVNDYSALTEEPPPYDPSKTQVPQSPPPGIFDRLASPSNSLLVEDSVLSDPGYAPEKASPPPAITAVIESTPSAVGKRKRPDKDRDAVRQSLSRRFESWLHLAFHENARVYDHAILRQFFDDTIPTSVDECNTDKFDVALAFATAVLACDPRGAGCELYWEHKERFFELVDDVRALVLWTLQRRGGVGSGEALSLPTWRKFMDLGAAARTRLKTGEREGYDGAKARITAEFVLRGSGCVGARRG